ncbi:Twitching motility protein PilT [Petrocella atlantisensis]|uniref:Twitching motility protein PilT n=1 Tax=Petrocella atlantisensis TaxID=2173034 RepID=A0A3P7RZ33_9FIRM|nr:twitching motility protein PilT [Petrocella atlantisensis]PKM54508.1 MAG: twitching motility protein PilT [Firmicutes bacterium HGW-Firmicutes-5]VDN45969.1 Twitching motility protein PilT [Petrocella atlantisensis]
MIRLVAGDTGEGKTKALIDMANNALTTTKGHIVYIDLDSSHMYDLRHEIRYINISDYPIADYKEFFGFMCGILSEDSDITEVYADGLLRQAHIDEISKSDELIKKLKAVSDKFDVRFVFSLTCDTCKVPDFLEEFLVKA